MSSSGAPPDLTFVLDEALGRNIVAGALRAAGLRIEILTDHYAAGTPDAVWLPEIGRRGWVLLTKDKRIRSRPAEVVALIAGDVRAFCLTGGEMRGEAMARAFLAAMPRIRSLVDAHAGPLVATVSPAGAVTVLWPDLPGLRAGNQVRSRRRQAP